jgi:hypothetical protein
MSDTEAAVPEAPRVPLTEQPVGKAAPGAAVNACAIAGGRLERRAWCPAR